MDLSSPRVVAIRARLAVRFGAEREPWWQRLPTALADLATRWELALGDAVGRGNTSLVMRCRRADGRDAILKLTPDPDLARAEADALQTWRPSGRVPMLWALDASIGALLMEAIPAETPVSETGQDVAVQEIAELIGGPHRIGDPSAVHDIRTLLARVEFIFEHWIARHQANPSIPRRMVTDLEGGRRQARALAQQSGGQVLLHATCTRPLARIVQ